MPRPISFKRAKAAYVHRFTMEHVPAWAADERPGGTFYAPQYRTDAEWYAATLFPGEGHLGKREEHCYSTGQTWPLGMFLGKPYRRA